jgi:hypothetical protein
MMVKKKKGVYQKMQGQECDFFFYLFQIQERFFFFLEEKLEC